MKIVIDAMGGDYAPAVVVEGAIQAVKEFGINIVLVGIKDQVQKELSKYNYPSERFEIVHASEVVGMHEPATISIRGKKDCSITVGLKLLRDKSYDAYISAGNTGAVVCAATVVLGMIPGVERPAIGLVIPTLNKFSFLIDVGANTDPKPQHMIQSALMAQIYAQQVLQVDQPKVGLINIGEEAGKGSDFSKETHKLFSESLKNFIGNVEANEIYAGKCDCMICDGFVGNVVIKVSEGLMESAGSLIKREIKKSPLALLGALLMKNRLMHIKKMADYSEYGGAPLLGVNGLVMISHGRSNPKAIKNAIKAAIREIEHDVLGKLVDAVKDQSPQTAENSANL